MKRLKEEAKLRKEALLIAMEDEEQQLDYLESYRRVVKSMRKRKKEARREAMICMDSK